MVKLTFLGFKWTRTNRAITQAVSCRLFTAATRVRFKIYDGQHGIGAGFLQVFRVPLQIFVSSTPPHSFIIIINIIWGLVP
jgi:hypothetical protein